MCLIKDKLELTKAPEYFDIYCRIQNQTLKKRVPLLFLTFTSNLSLFIEMADFKNSRSAFKDLPQLKSHEIFVDLIFKFSLNLFTCMCFYMFSDRWWYPNT